MTMSASINWLGKEFGGRFIQYGFGVATGLVVAALVWLVRSTPTHLLFPFGASLGMIVGTTIVVLFLERGLWAVEATLKASPSRQDVTPAPPHQKEPVSPIGHSPKKLHAKTRAEIIKENKIDQDTHTINSIVYAHIKSKSRHNQSRLYVISMLPPRIPLLFLGAVAPVEGRDRDIKELYAGYLLQCSREGEHAARRWYWSNALRRSLTRVGHEAERATTNEE